MPRFWTALAFALLFLATAGASRAEERWETLPEPAAMPEAAESGKASVNGIDMYYAVYGAGDPVLLIHGGLGHADIWASQVAELSKTHKVIVADSRGHGRTSRDTQPFGYDLMMSDYIGLLDHLKVDKVALVGWSDGGIIGVDMAMKHPDRLTGVFAHAANVTTDGVDPGVETNKTFGAYIERSGQDYALLSPTPDQYEQFVGEIVKMWSSQPAWTKEDLATIKTPVWVVLGDHDEAVKRDHTEYMASVIPGSKLVILENASHFAMLQDPAGYNKAVADFLAAVK